MRNLNKNKQKMYYALHIGSVPIYEQDADGNVLYIEVDGAQVPVETGEKKPGWGVPVEFYGNISMSGGDAEEAEYGLDLSQYEAVLVTDKGLLPVDEKSRIWHDTEPVMNVDGTVDGLTADYTIVKINKSLNADKYILKAVVK